MYGLNNPKIYIEFTLKFWKNKNQRFSVIANRRSHRTP